MIDLRVYRMGGSVLLDRASLYDAQLPGSGLPFTYPPFAAIAMVPLAAVPWGVALVRLDDDLGALHRAALARRVAGRRVDAGPGSLAGPPDRSTGCVDCLFVAARAGLADDPVRPDQLVADRNDSAGSGPAGRCPVARVLGRRDDRGEADAAAVPRVPADHQAVAGVPQRVARSGRDDGDRVRRRTEPVLGVLDRCHPQRQPGRRAGLHREPVVHGLPQPARRRGVLGRAGLVLAVGNLRPAGALAGPQVLAGRRAGDRDLGDGAGRPVRVTGRAGVTTGSGSSRSASA